MTKKFNEIDKGFVEKCEEYIEEKTIKKGKVLLTRRDPDLILLVDFEGHLAYVPEEEIDYQLDWNSYAALVNKEIIFVVKQIDEETGLIRLSRKEAQEIMEEEIKKDLLEGKAFTAEITGLLDYGAYVAINDVYALMRNSDYSDGYIPISDELDVGDKIEVKLNSIAQESGRISVEPVNKRKVEGLLDFSMFERDQVVAGKIRSVRPFGAFVGIAPGVDGLCNIPAVGEIEEGSDVKFRITRVFTEEVDGEEVGRVRGKIISIKDEDGWKRVQ